MRDVCYSVTFMSDLEKLMPRHTALVVKGILDTMALDPQLALETVSHTLV